MFYLLRGQNPKNLNLISLSEPGSQLAIGKWKVTDIICIKTIWKYQRVTSKVLAFDSAVLFPIKRKHRLAIT